MAAATARVLWAGALALVAGARVGRASAPTIEDPFTRFVATLRDGEVVVECALSIKPELARLVVRYRTDGVCPISASDGMAVADLELPQDQPSLKIERKPASVANTGSACFSAFACTHSGEVRGRATSHVVVRDAKAPEPATNLRRATRP